MAVPGARSGQVAEEVNSFWPARERRLWSLTLFAGLLLQFMSASAGPVTMVALAEEFQWDKGSQGSVLSSYFWGSGMTQLAGGWVSDIYSGDNVLYFTSTAWIAVVLLTPMCIRMSSQVYLSSSTVYLIIRFVMGLLQGATPGAMASLLGRKLETRYKSSVNGMIQSGACIGTVLVGLFGSLMLNYYNWTSVFYGIGLIGVAWLLLWKWLLRGPHTVIKLLPRERGEVALTGRESKLLNVPWMAILSHSPLWAMVVANISVSICFNVLSTWLPIYFHDTFPQSQSKGWIFNVVPWLVNSTCAFFSGIWADNLSHRGFSTTRVRKFFNILTQLGPAVSLVLLSYVDTFAPALSLMTVAIGMTGFHNAGGNVNAQDMAPEYAGSVSGVTNTIGTFAVFVAVYFTGYFLRVFQSWTFYFNVVSGICVFGCVVFTLFGSAEKIT